MKGLEDNGYIFHYEENNKRWVAFKKEDREAYLNQDDRIKEKVIYSNSYTTLKLFLNGKY